MEAEPAQVFNTIQGGLLLGVVGIGLIYESRSRRPLLFLLLISLFFALAMAFLASLGWLLDGEQRRVVSLVNAILAAPAWVALIAAIAWRHRHPKEVT